MNINLRSVLFVLFIGILPLEAVSAETYGGPEVNSTIQGSVWTESDWVAWWQGIEDQYLGGVSYEKLYWKVRLDLEALGQTEPFLDEIDFPAPYAGWGDPGSGDDYEVYSQSQRSQYPSSQRSFSANGTDPGLQYKCEPIDNRCPRGAPPFSVIEPPPMWIAASMSLLGGNLMMIPHPGGKVVGLVFSNAGGVIVIWIEKEEASDDKDDE